MANVRLDITMSLDGYVAEPNDSVERLHEWLFTGETTNPAVEGSFKTSGGSTRVFDEFLRTMGAFVVGRRMFDAAQAWGGRSPFRDVTTFVVTHHVPDGLGGEGSGFTFVTDGVESAVERAKAAAGDKVVSIGGGANIAQQCLRAGLVDEIQIHLAPLLLGQGIRLFDDVGPAPVELEQARVIEAPGITHVLYRVAKPSR